MELAKYIDSELDMFADPVIGRSFSSADFTTNLVVHYASKTLYDCLHRDVSEFMRATPVSAGGRG